MPGGVLMNGQHSGQGARIVHITDTHLFRDRDECLLAFKTQESFEAVLDCIAEREAHFDLVLATGDIAQDGSVEAYQRFGRTLERFAVPFYWIPGNHDKPDVMYGVDEFPRAFDKRILAGNWQILMLDTCVPGEVHGWLEDEELAFLDEQLSRIDADPEVEHTLVCLHHNPIPGTAEWMQGIGLHNAESLFAILERHDSVRAVVYGHIHQELDFVRSGIRYFCTPSTCIQFKPGVRDFALDPINPAYRWLTLRHDGSLETGVERISGFDQVDQSSSGY